MKFLIFALFLTFAVVQCHHERLKCNECIPGRPVLIDRCNFCKCNREGRIECPEKPCDYVSRCKLGDSWSLTVNNITYHCICEDCNQTGRPREFCIPI